MRRLRERTLRDAEGVGILTVREGLRWHLIEKGPSRYDFSSALTILDAARNEGIEVVWDLFHFGWPVRLDIFDADWVKSFADFAAAFARFLRREMMETSFVAPANELSFVAWGGGDVGYLNPFATGRGHELKRQVIRGVISASEALRSEMPEVRLVAPEPVIHMIGDPAVPDDQRLAEEYRTSMFETWDMISGRLQPELGGRQEFLDVIGINYYDRNQSWRHGKTIWRHEPEYRPFREILADVYERYERPMFISETGTEGEDRPSLVRLHRGRSTGGIARGRARAWNLFVSDCESSRLGR